MCPLYSPNMSLYLTLFHCLFVYLFFQHRRWFSKVISERYILQRTKCFHQNKSWTHCEERREVSLPRWKGTPLLVSLFKQEINISTVIKALLAIIYSWTASSGDISSVTIGLWDGRESDFTLKSNRFSFILFICWKKILSIDTDIQYITNVS